ncbi:hypothetical protein M514_08878 [Trichuris suis]|uniref:Uncharacterized protein n=1 Tax=Trichuris suis TaxID=68888 RepID=A0A085LZ54_9BILA|nr:hypothetical protein M513_08878 [Trichuris suis]KFD66934.1 hypothetical protein M514_08878 [Trichuris suis]
MAAQSWNSLMQNTLGNSWNKILTGRRPSVGLGSNDADQVMEEITHSVGMVSICTECDKPDVERQQWLACDSEDQGYQVMNDEEIIEFVLNQAADTEEEEEDGNKMDELGDLKPEQALPSNNEAFHYLEEALRWFET